MLPSAVNDTMRDMMSQIRDAGDGIRGGTYTMTAPVITGGSITGVALTGNTFTSPVITGGSINNTPIGATTPSTGVFTTLGASGVATFAAGTVSAPAITTTGDTNTGIYFPAADTIAFTEGGVEAGRFTSTGALQLNGNLTFSGTGNRITGDFSNATLANRVIFQTSTTNGNTGVYAIPNGTGNSTGWAAFNASNLTNVSYLNASIDSTAAIIDSGRFGSGTFLPMTFSTSGSERMRVTSTGEVGIGLSSSTILNGFWFGEPSGNSQLLIGHPNGTSAGSAYEVYYYNGNVIGSINQNGTTGVTFTTTSDYRLKENVAPMTGALDTVAQLKPCTYTWKADGSDGQGFIAHELQAIVPDAVTGEKDAVNEDGSIKAQGIDTSFLVATLTAAIQELKAELDGVKAELATLKA
jgi:hypothetical protein